MTAVAPYIKTRSGLKFSYAQPLPEQVNIRDITHSLSRICRFNGHTIDFFSVAQHSVEVCMLTMRHIEPAHKVAAGLAALLHDAHEAYIGDFPTPFKEMFGPAFGEIEGKVLEAIYEHFQINQIMSAYRETWKWADRAMLFSDAIRWGMDGEWTDEEGVVWTEPRDWVPDDFEPFFPDAVALPPGEAAAIFLQTFEILNGAFDAGSFSTRLAA